MTLKPAERILGLGSVVVIWVSVSRVLTHPETAWAATVTTAVASIGWGLMLGGVSVLLTVGVVCCQMPYGVDALAVRSVAGLSVTGLAIVLAMRLHPKAGRTSRGS